MKIRTDFVSNSSSSSFVLFGAELKTEELKKLYPEIDDLGWDLFEKSDLSYVEDCDNERFYVGLSPNVMKDEETLKQFKEKIVDTIVKICPSFNGGTSEIEFISGINNDGYLEFD